MPKKQNHLTPLEDLGVDLLKHIFMICTFHFLLKQYLTRSYWILNQDYVWN